MYEELVPSRHTSPTSTTYLRLIFDAWNFHAAEFASLGFFDVSTTPKCHVFHGSKRLSSVWSGCHQTDRLFCLPIFPTKMLRCNNCSTWFQEGSFLQTCCVGSLLCFRECLFWWATVTPFQRSESTESKHGCALEMVLSRCEYRRTWDIYSTPWLTCPNNWPAFSHQQGIVFEVHLTLVPMNS